MPSYPEGHPKISDERLLEVLLEKQRYASYMTTQMSFNPNAIAGWIGRMRSSGGSRRLATATTSRRKPSGNALGMSTFLTCEEWILTRQESTEAWGSPTYGLDAIASP